MSALARFTWLGIVGIVAIGIPCGIAEAQSSAADRPKQPASTSPCAKTENYGVCPGTKGSESKEAAAERERQRIIKGIQEGTRNTQDAIDRANRAVDDLVKSMEEKREADRAARERATEEREEREERRSRRSDMATPTPEVHSPTSPRRGSGVSEIEFFPEPSAKAATLGNLLDSAIEGGTVKLGSLLDSAIDRAKDALTQNPRGSLDSKLEITTGIYRRLDDALTDWDAVRASPTGVQQMELERALNPYNLRKGIYDYPKDVLDKLGKLLEQAFGLGGDR